jgi:hypothetical protein
MQLRKGHAFFLFNQAWLGQILKSFDAARLGLRNRFLEAQGQAPPNVEIFCKEGVLYSENFDGRVRGETLRRNAPARRGREKKKKSF